MSKLCEDHAQRFPLQIPVRFTRIALALQFVAQIQYLQYSAAVKSESFAKCRMAPSSFIPLLDAYIFCMIPNYTRFSRHVKYIYA